MAEVVNGLQTIYALSPDGCPGADVLPVTMRVWAQDLWESRKRSWHEQADTPCLRSAFSSLRSTCSRWPTPAKFWEHLPNRPAPKGRTLMDPQWGREREAESLGGMYRQFEELGRDRNGREIPQ